MHLTFNNILVYNADFNVKIHKNTYDGWNFNSGNYLFTTDTK